MIRIIKIIIPFLILIFCCSVAFADYTRYIPDGGITEDGNIDSTQGTWRESSNLVDDPQGIPLVADLDGDGTKEIVLIDDGDTVNLYRSQNGILDRFRAYQRPGGFALPIQQIELFDIDADGIKEIVIMDHRNIIMIEFNGSHIYLQNELNITPVGNTRTASFSCQSSNRCVAVYTDRNSFSNSISRVYGRTFNSNSMNEEKKLIKTDGLSGSNYYAYCMPDLRIVTWADVWDINEDYAVFTIIRARAGTTAPDNVNVLTIHLNASNQIDDNITIGWSEAGGGFWGEEVQLYYGDRYGSCSSEITGQRLTPILPHNFDDATDTLEFGYAMMLDTDEDYILDIKDSGGGAVRRFPQVTNQEGVLISNVFLSRILVTDDQTQVNDLCVFGMNDDDNIIKLLCGSLESQESDDAREMYLDLDDYPELDYNVPHGQHNYQRIAHSGEHKNQLITDSDTADDTFNPYEILTPYGLLGMDPAKWEQDPAGLTPKDGEMYPIMYFNNEPGVMTAVKTKKVGIVDYLFLQNGSLYLLDNGLVNNPGWISKVKFNPCLHDEDTGEPVAWKVGTEALINVRPDDDDGDLVRARVILYYGEDNITGALINLYNDTNEPESIGNFNDNEEALGGDSVTTAYDMAFMVRNITDTTDIIRMAITIGGINGNPATNGFIYDITMCPTTLSQFSSATEIDADCNVGPTVVYPNYDLSGNFGDGSKTVTIDFITPFDPLYPTYENYIIGFEYISAISLDNDNYKMSTDADVSIPLIKVNEFTVSTGISVDQKIPNEFGNIQLYGQQITVIERWSNWSSYFTPGNDIPFYFASVDELTPLSKIRVEANDIENPDDIDVKTFNFFVETSGVIFGECIEEFDYDNPVDEPSVTPCVTSEDCPGSQICENNVCVDQGLDDLADILLPPDSIPVAYRPIIGLIVILLVVVGVILALKEVGIQEGQIYLVASIMAAIIFWIVLIYIGIIPGWTLIVSLVTGGAIIGFLFWSKHRGG